MEYSDKIIFLDIDGVMNSHTTMEEYEKQGKERIWFHIPGPSQIAALQYIIDQTGANIVISSTWRSQNGGLLLWTCYLAVLGLKNGFVIDKTPKLWKKRGYEIQKWLDTYKSTLEEKNQLRAENPRPEIKSFVILDDDTDMVHLLPRLVKTSYHDGLTMEDAKRAVEILNKEL